MGGRYLLGPVGRQKRYKRERIPTFRAPAISCRCNFSRRVLLWPPSPPALQARARGGTVGRCSEQPGARLHSSVARASPVRAAGGSVT